MAWLSGLAGKAEKLLNQIDKNTAAVLSNEKSNYDEIPRMSSATRSPLRPNIIETGGSLDSPRRSASTMSRHTDPEIILGPSVLKAGQEEELIAYLNTPGATPAGSVVGTNPPTPSSLIVEASIKNSDSESDVVIHSGRTSPDPHKTVLDMPDAELSGDEEPSTYPTEENLSARQEIMQLHDAVSATRTDSDYQQKFENLRREYEYKLAQQRLEMELLIERSSEAREASRTSKKSETLEMTSKARTDYQKEIQTLAEKVHFYEKDAVINARKLEETHASVERYRSELHDTRVDLERHRARAMKTLQEKEKLIAELRNNSNAGAIDDTALMELNQLRQECEVLREENQQVAEQLRLSREELIRVELKVEEASRKAMEATREAQEFIAAERRKRIEAEEDTRAQLEEVRNLRNELEMQIGNWSTKCRKQETEITRLRSQLTAVSTPSSAVESRLASLTQTLVSKQQALESLTTEKNALRLQLERIEQEYRQLAASTRKNGYNSVNDTDDAKAQVPTFLIESPFDTGVTRRVKRAYSTLDAISVRTGVFLRRYPLARIFVIIYMAVLQLWVLVVLFSQSPEAH